MKSLNTIILLIIQWTVEVHCFTIPYYNEQQPATTCNTQNCRDIGDIVQNGMNRSVNPCDDFWEYACGNWISHTSIPLGEANWDRFKLLLKKMKERVREILESNIKQTDYDQVKKAKKWYRSCMNTGRREAVGIKPLESIIENIGGWPITMSREKWVARNISWQDIDYYYTSLIGQSAFYEVESEKDYGDLLRYKIMLKKAPLPLAYKLPIERKKFDEQDRTAYTKLIKNVAQAFIDAKGVRLDTNSILNDINDMVNFEAKLSKIKLGRLFDYPSVGYVASHYDQNFGIFETAKVNLANYIAQIYGFGNMTIYPNEVINVYYDWINELGILLKDTPMRTIANYVHWHFISDLIDVTNYKMNNFLSEFKRDTYGIRASKPRWERCVEAVHMHHAVATDFVKEYFPDRVKGEVSKMVAFLQQAMEGEITHSNWMSDSDKKSTIKKLKNIVSLIGYPDWYRDLDFMAVAYGSLNITANYFDNIMNWLKFVAEANSKILRSTDTRETWYGDPITINAFYRPYLNNINLPAATFQPPFFTSDLPQVVNYAMLGSIAGHEIAHAFDPLGIQFDDKGRYKMLAPNLFLAYFRHFRCFDEQYKKYNTNRVGVKTLNEDIADTQGAKAAYDAYESLSNQGNVPDARVPGLEEYTNEQSFFILFANLWCNKATPQFMRKKLMDEEDRHSLPRSRVIGTLSNMEEFAEAFSCPKGSTMNPQNKCDLWT